MFVVCQGWMHNHWCWHCCADLFCLSPAPESQSMLCLQREARVAKKEVKEMFKQEARRQHALPSVGISQLSLH